MTHQPIKDDVNDSTGYLTSSQDSEGSSVHVAYIVVARGLTVIFGPKNAHIESIRIMMNRGSLSVFEAFIG